jgi:hypothetical protein
MVEGARVASRSKNETRRISPNKIETVCLNSLQSPASSRRSLCWSSVWPRLQIEEGHRVHFHGYAIGVQIYRCTETAPGVFNWLFVAPEAVLFDEEGNVVAIHYAGPIWESNSGSIVKGARVDGLTMDQTAIPWLKLSTTLSEGPGIFEGTTFIQRVNTTGGLAPAKAATAANLGEEVGVPYTADYFFYRKEN